MGQQSFTSSHVSDANCGVGCLGQSMQCTIRGCRARMRVYGQLKIMLSLRLLANPARGPLCEPRKASYTTDGTNHGLGFSARDRARPLADNPDSRGGAAGYS